MKAAACLSSVGRRLRFNLWFVKAVGLNLLSRLPYHEQVYFRAQRLAGRHRLDAREMFKRAAELFALLGYSGRTIEGARVLEIGTGWFPFTPLLASLAGADRVYSVDIHPWLHLDNARRTLYALRPFLDEFATRAGCDVEDLVARYQQAIRAATSAPDLDAFLSRLDVHYLCPFDLTTSALPHAPVDVVFSSNVLEHVPPETLLEIHRATRRMLADDGVAVHRFNPGDHFSPLTGSTINFLRYSERAWKRLGGHGLSYHNRLRSCQHAALAREAGLRISFWADAVDQRAMQQLQRKAIEVDASFAGMDPAALCAHYSWLVLRRDDGPCLDTPRRVEWIDAVLKASPLG